jgi:radical SAM superfamily enzyme YgiQ (UPF0313 family)
LALVIILGMTKLKVLLGDLRHHTVGVHSTYVPVGVGYIAAYFEKILSPQAFEIKILTHPDEALDLIDEWKPDILGLSSYIWNSNLSNRVCEYAKEKNENIITILGGPEFPSGTGAHKFSEIIKNNCLEYLKEKPSVDYYCYADGETAFTSCVQEYIKFNFDLIKMRRENIIPAGAMALSNDKKNLLIGKPIARLGLSNKVDGRDCIPSPYLKGYLDKFLNGDFVPSFETARGCPFSCTFCGQGIDVTKMVSFSTKRMEAELSYVCEKVTKFSGSTSISFHDANWGMYIKDINLTDHILKLINEKNWPQFIEISTPKNKRQQILDIDSKLKNRVQIGLPQQSMNQETLKLIKRDNLTNEQYIEFVKELESRGKQTGCELIIPLPNETKETYFKSTKILMDCGVGVSTYTLMMLQGEDLGREEHIEKYGMKSKWRIVPRDFGTYRGKRVFDIERVCIATNTMPYKDYLACRRFSLLSHFFTYPVFVPIKKLLRNDLDISLYEFIFSIFETLESGRENQNDKKLPEKLLKNYFDFSQESEDELYDSKAHIENFFSNDKNYNKLLRGELGDNLLRKYAAKLISDALNEVIDLSIDTILKLLPKSLDKKREMVNVLESTRLWLKNLYIFDAIFQWDQATMHKPVITLEYDIPKWDRSHNESVLSFKRKTNYKMVYSKLNENINNELYTLYGKNHDKNFAIGKYFHQLNVNFDDIRRSSNLIPD